MNKARWAFAPELDESQAVEWAPEARVAKAFGPSRKTAQSISRVGPDRRGVVKLNAEARDIKIDLAKSAVIVIDMQNDFFREDGWFGLLGADLSPLYKAIDPINRLLPPMRAADVPIIWVNWGVRPDGFGLAAERVPRGRRHRNGTHRRRHAPDPPLQHLGARHLGSRRSSRSSTSGKRTSASTRCVSAGSGIPNSTGCCGIWASPR